MFKNYKMINVLNREIPNQLDEITIEQFETITEINNDPNLDPIDKHLKVFAYLGIPESEFWDYDVAEFVNVVKDFNKLVRDTKMIEKVALHKEKGYISEMLAIMFKREDLTPAEHYAEAHIKHKAKLIRKLTANIAVPYLIFIAEKISQQVKHDQPTQAVEPSNA